MHEDRALPLNQVVTAGPFVATHSLEQLLEEWDVLAMALEDLLGAQATQRQIERYGVAVRDLEWQAPVRPGQAFCTIGNYARQVVEAAVDSAGGPGSADAPGVAERALVEAERRKNEGQPYVCLTSPHRVGAPSGHIVVPDDVLTLDWEVEIAAILGAGHRAPQGMPPVVAGYCLANDMTIRSRVFREDLPGLGSDWIQSKGLAGSLPLGPWFVPVWQVPDVSALRLRLFVNDRLMQDDVAADMIFDVEEQVGYLARHAALAPGDVVCTGSPGGFGAHHGLFLGAGDEVRAEVAGLGEQIITCVGENPVDHRIPAGHTAERQV